MFNVTLKLKRPLVGLAVAAGLLVAAGPASASQSGPPIAPPHTEVNGYTHMEEIMFTFQSAVVSRAGGPAAGNPDTATEELFGNYNF